MTNLTMQSDANNEWRLDTPGHEGWVRNLQLVGRVEFASGAVAMRFVPSRRLQEEQS
jgi:hypothetical protein